MKSGYYAYYYSDYDSTYLDAIDLTDRFVPSTIDWENRETKKIGVPNYTLECNHVYSKVSFQRFRMDENDIDKAVQRMEKVKLYEMRSYMKMVQDTIEESVKFFSKYEDSEHLTCYYDATSLFCYHRDLSMGVKIDFANKLPAGWKDKRETLVKRYNEPNNFELTFYEYVLEDIENKIKNGIYKEMDSFDFSYFPSILERFNNELKRKFEAYDIDDIGHWLKRNLKL